MSCQTRNLCITQGDEKSYNLTFTAGGEALDITGSTVTMSIKKNVADDEPLVERTGTLTNPEGGLTNITLTEDDTTQPLGKYYYDIQIEGGGISLTTILKGKLEITWQVTE